MTNAAYSNLGILTGISHVFNNVQDDITSNQDMWHSWLQSDEPEKHTLPGITPERLIFQEICNWRDAAAKRIA